MGESACLLQQVQPFSYSAGIPNESNEGNPVHALGQSISFGRFMSESSAWEKWSTFSHNKYVEEAERYARPGSVAQKKAFFEAHYKTLAAKKAAAAAAALLEQTKDAESEAEGRVQASNSEMPALDQEVKASSTETGFIYDGKENNSDFVKFDSSKVEGAVSVAEHNVLLENNMKNECFEKDGVVYKAEIRDMELKEATQVENFAIVNQSRKLEEVIELELSEATQMEKPLLKSAITNQDEFEVTSKKKPPHSSSKVSACGRTSKVPLPSSPAKFTAPIRPKKGNNLTPVAKKSAMDISDRKKPTPKSSHRSINFTPAKEFSRLTSTIIRKIDGSRIASNSKASKECPTTPLRTPNMASTSGRPKQSSATPWSQNRSARTPVNPSASVSKTARGKWHFLPTEKKSQSPGIFASFSLRTEERAARRKQRLEEKFNFSQEQKVEQQTTLKEKAETELKKLRQSFCFKARPLPEFYKERRTIKEEMQKVPLTKPESPALGRKCTPSKANTAQSKSSFPYQKSSVRDTCFKHVVPEKKNQISVPSLASRVAMTAHENTSPNIQQHA